VRKRVIKLLKGIFGTTAERDIKVDICCKMIGLTADTDENIKVS
jgi:cohesin loading factor subunit SCC2